MCSALQKQYLEVWTMFSCAVMEPGSLEILQGLQHGGGAGRAGFLRGYACVHQQVEGSDHGSNNSHLGAACHRVLDLLLQKTKLNLNFRCRVVTLAVVKEHGGVLLGWGRGGEPPITTWCLQ